MQPNEKVRHGVQGHPFSLVGGQAGGGGGGVFLIFKLCLN